MRNNNLTKVELNRFVLRYKKAKTRKTRERIFNFIYLNYTSSFDEFMRLVD